MARSNVTQLVAMISRSSVLSRGRATGGPSDMATSSFFASGVEDSKIEFV
jgi:hypothetical protein